jgi:hypothetical protein
MEMDDSDLRKSVLRKLAELIQELEHGAYSREELEFLNLELSGEFLKLFKKYSRLIVKLGWDAITPEDFLEEITDYLFEIRNGKSAYEEILREIRDD